MGGAKIAYRRAQAFFFAPEAPQRSEDEKSVTALAVTMPRSAKRVLFLIGFQRRKCQMVEDKGK